MNRRSRLVALVLGALAGGAGLALPGQVLAAEPSCAAPEGDRAPDPRCRERLDGRASAETSSTRIAGRLALGAPRLASRMLFWPIVKTSGLVESYRLYDWMKAILTSDDGRIGVRPELSYSTDFLITGGARLFFQPAGGAGSKLVARAHTGGPSAYLGELSVQGPTALGLRARASWNRRHDRLFGGIGPASLEQLQAGGRGLARYASDNTQAELAWSRALPWQFTGTLTGDLQRRDYGGDGVRGGVSVVDRFGLSPEACALQGLPAGCLDPDQLAGFERGLRLAHAGGALALHLGSDDRDGRRLHLGVDGAYAHGLASDPSQHLRLGAETVLALGGIDRALLLRLRGEAVEDLGAAPIPFDELVAPAGPTGLRGFPEGRFRGASGWVATAEYRWFIAFNLDASVFVDVGSVAGPRFQGVRQARMFPSVGMSLRLFSTDAQYWKARMIDGLQVVYAREAGVRVMFSTATF
jgi:hypothetical protein